MKKKHNLFFREPIEIARYQLSAQLGYLFGYSKKPALSRLMIKMVKKISNFIDKEPKLHWVQL